MTRICVGSKTYIWWNVKSYNPIVNAVAIFSDVRLNVRKYLQCREQGAVMTVVFTSG